MLVKNNSKKIIGFGETALLPDATLEISDSYKNNAVFKNFLKNGNIKVIKNEVPQQSAVDNNTNNAIDNDANGDGSATPPANKPTAEEIKACSKKEDYVKLAEKYGIEVTDSMLVKDIKAALGA